MSKCSIRSNIDVRQIASLARYYAVVVGERLPSRNALISRVVEDFHDILTRHKLIEPISESEVALKVLSEFGYSKLVASVCSSKSYLDSICQENILADKLDEQSLESSTHALAEQLARNI